MTVAFDEDLLAPMLAGWQKVAIRYGLRVYVFRAASKIFAVTNEEQGFGELVTIFEPTPCLEEPTRAAAPPTGPIARPLRTAKPSRAPIGGDRNPNGSSRRSGLYEVSYPKLAYPQIFADLDQHDPHPRPAHNSNSAEPM
jgi:hypothetical protein